MSKERRSVRLKGYDYAQCGAYFLTVCTQHRETLFGLIEDREVRLNAAGRMVEDAWACLPDRFSNLSLDSFTVMPNHIHGILLLTDDLPDDGDSLYTGDHKDRPYEVISMGTKEGSVGRIVQAFKSISTNQYGEGVRIHDWPTFPGKLWQRNYYEHVVRDKDDLNRLREYISQNPEHWEDDENNPTYSGT